MKKLFLIIITLIITALPSNANIVKISVDQAVEIALENNLELKAKRKNLEIARQEVRAANALKNPQFQSNFLFGKVTRGNSSQFGAVLPVEIAKRGVRKKAALANLNAVSNSIKESEHNLKLDVMRAYFKVLYLKSVLVIMQNREKLYKDMIASAQAKPKNSPNYNIELLQSDIRHRKQLVELNKVRANLLTAQFNFNKVMNLEDTNIMYDVEETSLFDTKNVNIFDIDIPSYDQIEKIALVCSYSLRISDNYIEKSEYELKAAKHQRIPDLTVGGGYAYQTARQTGDEALPGAFVSVGFDIPVLYTYKPEIKKAETVLEKAKTDKLSYENKLKMILKINYNDFKYAKENMGHYRDIMKESDEILKMSQERYKKGQTSLMNVMLNENSHNQILYEYIDSIAVYYEAYLDLMYNMGHDLILMESI